MSAWIMRLPEPLGSLGRSDRSDYLCQPQQHQQQRAVKQRLVGIGFAIFLAIISAFHWAYVPRDERNI
jgi:hypothetical protein